VHPALGLIVILLLGMLTPVQAVPVGTGSPSTLQGTTANTASTTVTVPAEAQLMVCGVVGYATARYFSGGSITIEGQPLTLVAGDTNTNFFMGALGYRVLPPTGARTLAVAWSGSAPSIDP
jgi:hypothetical protein